MNEKRVETDGLGEISVAADAYYGAATARALQNFPISGQGMPPRFLDAVAMIKREAAWANAELGRLDPKQAAAIARAADEVIAGKFADQFPVDVFQTGSGTSTNMNVNEVLARRANELLTGIAASKAPVHPNDHVNAGQSSNDVIPSAIHVSAAIGCRGTLLPALATLRRSLELKAKAFADVLKVGRTHLQDAVPMTLGQEFSGYAAQIAQSEERLLAVEPRLVQLALGGTAVGTGLNAPPGFADAVAARLAAASGIPFVCAVNRFAEIAAKDTAVELSGALKGAALALGKIANDLRWLASGPRCGLGEIRLPVLQPGSSIMPGKVNPVIPEAVLMVVARIVGSDATITWAGASGNFELNTMMPLIGNELLMAIKILSSATVLLAQRCVDGVAVVQERLAEFVERSTAVVTALAPHIGYEKAAELAHQAERTGRSVRELAVESGILSPGEVDALLDPRAMTGGG